MLDLQVGNEVVFEDVLCDVIMVGTGRDPVILLDRNIDHEYRTTTASKVTLVNIADNPFQPGTRLFDTFGDDYAYVVGTRAQVWTLLDDGKTVLKGRHHVNVLGYYVEQEPKLCPRFIG